MLGNVSKVLKNKKTVESSKMIRCVLLNIIILLLAIVPTMANTVSIISWNIRDFGKSKNQEEILTIAKILNDHDIVAIQEVVAGYGGAQAIAKLNDQLNRMGAKWDFRVSDPTQSPPYKTERYAFLWKPSKVKMIGSSWLENSLANEIYREPFLAKFDLNGHKFILLNFHSRRFDESPEEEAKHFKPLVDKYSSTPSNHHRGF